MVDALVVRTRAFSDNLKRAAIALENTTWGQFGYLNYTHSHRAYYDQILETYADYQLCLVNRDTDLPIALANCVPAHYDGGFDGLPAEGWDWLVESGANGREGQANVLGALAISVPDSQRGKGYAARMLHEMRLLTKRRGFDALIAPVRPTVKWEYPYVTMANYIGWHDAAGRVFDPWLRSHLSQGGRLVGPCERSMVVKEHIAFWETWAGRTFEASGNYLVDGALVPISIDLERQIGVYEEPNVWVAYAS